MRITGQLLKALCVAALFSGVCATIRAQDASSSSLSKLVTDSAQRLSIAYQVALAKWDSGTSVEDTTREAQVIQNAVTAGQAKGLDEALVAGFFRAQIEANKVVQYSLLADWRRSGKAPDHTSVHLATTIRPELDHLQTTLIEDLSHNMNVRSQANCQTLVAKEAGHYVSEKRNFSRAVDAIALDRSLAYFCMKNE